MIYNQLPPLNAIKAFDAVVRHGSISEASRILCVSQSAVSRHISNLESFLDCKLLSRSKLGTVCTKQGQEFFDQISHSLNTILDVSNKIRATQSGINIVKVSSLSSFALRWLVPRLNQFQQIHPDIVLDISISDKRPNFEISQIDCAIVSEAEHVLAKHDHILFKEELVVVASPLLINDKKLSTNEFINTHPLIHTSSRAELWENLQNHYEIATNTKSNLGLSFQDFYISIAACVAGSGIALVPSFLIRKELADGSLIQLLKPDISSGKSYQLAISAFKSTNPSTLALQNWLLYETAPEREE